MKKEVADSRLERLKSSKPIVDVRLDLETFIRQVRDGGLGSLRSDITDDETRAMLRREIDKLVKSTPELISLIELHCKTDREDALLAMWDALAAAYWIGYGTISKENAGAVQLQQGSKLNPAKTKLRNEGLRDKDRGYQAMKRVVDRRYRPGDEEHPSSFAHAMRDDINRERKKIGLEPITRDDQAERYIKSKAPRS